MAPKLRLLEFLQLIYGQRFGKMDDFGAQTYFKTCCFVGRKRFRGLFDIFEIELNAVLIVQLVYCPILLFFIHLFDQGSRFVMMEGYDGSAYLTQQQVFVNLFHQKCQIQKIDNLWKVSQSFIRDDEGSELQQHLEQFQIQLYSAIFSNHFTYDLMSIQKGVEKIICLRASGEILVRLLEISGNMKQPLVTFEGGYPQVTIYGLDLGFCKVDQLICLHESQLFPDHTQEGIAKWRKGQIVSFLDQSSDCSGKQCYVDTGPEFGKELNESNQLDSTELVNILASHHSLLVEDVKYLFCQQGCFMIGNEIGCIIIVGE